MSKTITAYKQSEVGLIPSDWDELTFKDICWVNQGLQIPISQRIVMPNKNSKVYITIQYLNDGKTIEYIDDYVASVCCNKEDILMTRTGNTGIVVSGVEGVFHNNFFKINFDRQKIDKDFLVYYLTQSKTKKIILAKAGTSTIPDLNHRDFYSIPIPLPPTKAEQTAIATALSDADALISSLEKLIAKKRNIKQGAMQKLLQPAAGWEVKKLGEICLILNSLRIPIKESSRIKGETPYYGANGIQGYIEGFTHNGEYVLVAEDGANDLNNYPINYTSGKIWVNNHAHVLQGLISVLSTKFLSYILKSIDFQDVLVGGTRAKLNKSILEKIEIAFPFLIEQTRIATILSDMDAEISALETKLEKYRKVKLGMMQNLLTGRIRLV